MSVTNTGIYIYSLVNVCGIHLHFQPVTLHCSLSASTAPHLWTHCSLNVFTVHHLSPLFTFCPLFSRPLVRYLPFSITSPPVYLHFFFLPLCLHCPHLYDLSYPSAYTIITLPTFYIGLSPMLVTHLSFMFTHLSSLDLVHFSFSFYTGSVIRFFYHVS